jgi:hypothetical protein
LIDRKLIITTRTHFAALESLFFLATILAVILYFFSFDKGMAIAFAIGFGIDATTSLYLHFEYLSKNKGEEYEVHDTELIRWKGGEKTIYKNDEIEKIIIYLSPSLFKNSNFHILSIESYHYAIVKLKIGEELILTCLLSPRIDKSLKQMRGVLFENRKRLFCMIK